MTLLPLSESLNRFVHHNYPELCMWPSTPPAVESLQQQGHGVPHFQKTGRLPSPCLQTGAFRYLFRWHFHRSRC